MVTSIYKDVVSLSKNETQKNKVVLILNDFISK